jgi:fructuronate reductase
VRLASETLQHLPPEVMRYTYDRAAQAVGIVHFGIGAFHRAHQAWYTDKAMEAGDRDWMICGVSLRSGGVSGQLNPQDGLFTVTERTGDASATRLCGSVHDVLTAGRSHHSVLDQLTAPQTRIVSFTVTEKGYCRAPDGTLDFARADDDSFYPLLAEAMRERQRAKIPGLTLLSCDNLAGNGDVLRDLMDQYLAARSPDLLDWFQRNCRCPSTMVDRIVPATNSADLSELEQRIGLRDEAAVFTEPFSQWVIEDDFAGGRPCWEKVGAQLVADVAPFETAKLRMLNGAHSALAYLGLEREYSYVHEAIADPAIRALVERLMREEAAPTIEPAPRQDLDGYADALVARFENTALQHRLAQIAMDGSQKIPQRWLATLAERQRRGEKSPALLTALAAWLRHIRGDGHTVDDPMADQFAAAWREAGREGMADTLFGARGLLQSEWRPEAADKAMLVPHGDPIP